MNKEDMTNIAKSFILESVGGTYYKLADTFYTLEEKKGICEEIKRLNGEIGQKLGLTYAQQYFEGYLNSNPEEYRK
jgi:hypothetical protein